jgi:hypothetical protein
MMIVSGNCVQPVKRRIKIQILRALQPMKMLNAFAHLSTCRDPCPASSAGGGGRRSKVALQAARSDLVRLEFAVYVPRNQDSDR